MGLPITPLAIIGAISFAVCLIFKLPKFMLVISAAAFYIGVLLPLVIDIISRILS